MNANVNGKQQIVSDVATRKLNILPSGNKLPGACLHLHWSLRQARRPGEVVA